MTYTTNSYEFCSRPDVQLGWDAIARGRRISLSVTFTSAHRWWVLQFKRAWDDQERMDQLREGRGASEAELSKHLAPPDTSYALQHSRSTRSRCEWDQWQCLSSLDIIPCGNSLQWCRQLLPVVWPSSWCFSAVAGPWSTLTSSTLLVRSIITWAWGTPVLLEPRGFDGLHPWGRQRRPASAPQHIILSESSIRDYLVVRKLAWRFHVLYSLYDFTCKMSVKTVPYTFLKRWQVEENWKFRICF